MKNCGIQPLVESLPDGVLAAKRAKGDKEYLFIMNFSREERTILIPEGTDLLSNTAVKGEITLCENGAAVIEIEK